MEKEPDRRLEEKLWLASTKGDLRTVKYLVENHPDLDVNWKDPEWDRTPIYRACYGGHTEVVQFLMKHPRIDINLVQKEGAGPLMIACQEGRTDLVLILLQDPRIDPNLPRLDGASPLLFAAQGNHVDAVEIMLADPRVNVNAQDEIGVCTLCVTCELGNVGVLELLLGDQRTDVDLVDHKMMTSLWVAAQEGQLEITKRILALRPAVRTGLRSSAGPEDWCDTTAREQARSHHYEAIDKLLGEFENDCLGVSARLRRELGFDLAFASELFALIIFLGDGYLTFIPSLTNTNFERFHRIARCLPLELQMVLCLRTFGSSRVLIPRAVREKGFLQVTKKFWLKEQLQYVNMAFS